MIELSLVAASPLSALMPTNPNKDEKHRIGRFVTWVHLTQQSWWDPDVQAYVEYLRRVHELSENSIATHLSTIRAQAERLHRNNEFRVSLWQMADERDIPREAAYYFVQEHITQLANAFHPSQVDVSVSTKQDKADSEGIRLSPSQVMELVAQPGKDTLIGLRDTAMLALLVCTGIRVGELCNLQVHDLIQHWENHLSLRITAGKGRKQRMIPYGAMTWCIHHVEDWMEAAGITSGPLFRGFYGFCLDGRMRENALSTRAVQKILKQYRITINDVEITLSPHDLRRTYARNCFEAGMPVEAIKDNLGHDQLETTLGYIGTLNAALRAPSRIFENPYTEDS